VTILAQVRRRAELGLLLLAGVITGAAYTLASLGTTASVPANIGPFLGVIFGLFLLAHLAVRRLAPQADSMLLPLAAVLNGIGYVFIARINDELAGLQASWTAVGIVGYVLTLAVIRDIKVLQRYRYTFGLLGLMLLVLPLVPGIGQEINGSRIWVSLGPVNFQPGEFAKICLAVFFAGYLTERRELLGVATFRIGRINTPDPKHFAPILLAVGVSLIVVVFERDLGSALLCFVLFMVMLYVATGRGSYVVAGRSCSSRAPGSPGRSSPTCRRASARGSTRGTTRRAPGTRSSRLPTRSPGVAPPARAPASGSPAGSRRTSRTSSSRSSERSSACWVPPPCCARSSCSPAQGSGSPDAPVMRSARCWRWG
jgi:hypothetical protein